MLSAVFANVAPLWPVIKRVLPLSKSHIVPPCAKFKKLVLPVEFGVKLFPVAPATKLDILVVELQPAACVVNNV